MNTKILMIAPEFPVTYWGFQHSLKFVNKKANFPPLGLLTVAAMLPDDFEIRLVDMNVSSLTEENIKWASMVFISAMIVQKNSMQAVIQQCKNYGKTIVAGGPYPTESYQSIRGVDHFILGEAEVTLPLFLADLKAGYPQNIYKSDEKPYLIQTPVPRFDLIKRDLYFSMSLQYSRGCPFQCEFCDIIKLFGRVPRVKAPDQFMAELESLKNTGYRGSVFIVDDNFIGNKAELKKMLPRLIDWQKNSGSPFTFFTEASVDLAKEDWLMDLMVAAGFNMAFLGIETPVTESLLLTGKAQNTKLGLLESVHAIQAKGIEVSAGFILGFDNDPADIFQRQIDFIEKSSIPTAMVGLLTALPGTKLYERLIKEKRISAESTGNNTHDHSLNFIPVMNEEALLEGYQQVLSAIYKPRKFFDRCHDLIQRLPKTYNNKLGSQPDFRKAMLYFGAFIKSFFVQTFSSYGWHYLMFLGKVIFTRPSFFVKAIQLAINGHHYFVLTNGHDARINAESITFHQYLKRTLNSLRDNIEKIGKNFSTESITELFKFRSDMFKEIKVRSKNIQSERKPLPVFGPLFSELEDSFMIFGEKMIHSLQRQFDRFDKQKRSDLWSKFLFSIKGLKKVHRIKVKEKSSQKTVAVLVRKLEYKVDKIIFNVETLIRRKVPLIDQSDSQSLYYW